MDQVQLGMRYLDPVTGYKGVAISRTTYLNGCVRVALQSDILHEGKPVDPYYVDEPQLEELPGEEIKRGRVGGPGDVPPPRSVPNR